MKKTILWLEKQKKGDCVDKVIQFIANYDDWVAVKKLKIEEKTDPRTIMEFLAGLGIGIDRKIEQNLGKLVDLNKINSTLNELISSGKGVENIAKVLATISGIKMNSVINSECNKPELQKNEQKELLDFCKAYVMKKALKECNLKVDFSEINIPGMKKSKKKKG